MYFSCSGEKRRRGSLEGGADPVLIRSCALVQWPMSCGPLDTALECLAMIRLLSGHCLLGIIFSSRQLYPNSGRLQMTAHYS